nr:hypothetical protein [Tanacetum cinerariifolium]
MQDDEPEPFELKKVIKVVTITRLMTEVVTVVATTAVSTITAAPSAARRRKGVVIRDPEETATPSTILHFKPKSKDKGKGIWVKRKEKEDNAVLRYQTLKRKPQTEAHARKNMMYFNSNVAFLEKSKEQLEEKENRALKRQSKSFEQQAAKNQKLDEEVEELKKHLQIVPNDEDDVYTEATPLDLKSLVKEIFSSTKPTDDKERTLWFKLKRLFEPDTDDTLWKLQRNMHDPLTWRLYDTCGVHHVSTEKGMDIFMLVEKEYSLSKGVLTLMLVNKLLQRIYAKGLLLLVEELNAAGSG